MEDVLTPIKQKASSLSGVGKLPSTAQITSAGYELVRLAYRALLHE